MPQNPFTLLSDPHRCSYLPVRVSQTEYLSALGINREQLTFMIDRGWRTQGAILFKPRCPSCNACQSLRVPTQTFSPNRSQRRVIKANKQTVLQIGEPNMTAEQIALNVQHHNHHAQQKGWRTTNGPDAARQIKTLGSGPFVEEWSYHIDGTLVAVSYVSVLDDGLSGIYFFHHPDYRQYSLGTWCVLSMILRAKELGLPYAHLGLYVPGCRSMEYKGKFAPAEILTNGQWVDFIDESEDSGTQ